MIAVQHIAAKCCIEAGKMGKIRYVCTKCTNGFTTLGAAKRHLRNIEHGIGAVVSEADFRTGLSTGIYTSVVARKRPLYKKAPLDLSAIAGEEYLRAFWRRAGELHCEEMLRNPKEAKTIHSMATLLLGKEFEKLFSS